MKNLNKCRRFAQIAGVLLISTSFLYSCNDGYLSGSPLDKVSDADIWEDIGLVETFVNNIYGDMRTGHPDHMSLSVTSDESFARERTGAHLVQAGGINPSDLGHIDWTWEHYYEIISSCNIFTTNIAGETLDELSAQDEEKLNRMIGEVKVLRAFAYHRLSSLFGGVPLITSTFSLNENMEVERNSYDEIVNFIVSELDEAATLLPASYPGSELGRITEGAALAVKSRVLLYAASPLHNPSNDQSKWQEAADAAKTVVDLNRYSLHPDYAETFTEEGNFNDEVIWELVINSDVWQRFNLERNLFPNGNGGWAVTVPTRRQVDTYETINGLQPEDDPTYDPQNPWVNRDPRFHATILHDEAPWRDREIEVFRPGGIDSPDSPIAPWNSSYTGYYTKKFVDEDFDRSLEESSSANWIMVRYAEMLLNYAEAQYFLGNEPVAREYVNMVRSRPSVDMPDVTDSGEDLLDRIKNERRVEFYLEEHRFFDIRRWMEEFPANDWIQKVDVALNTDTGEKTISYSNLQEWALPEYTYILPIPEEEIQRNSLLEQNPGYN